jgi:type I restriction enzyme R subunit
MACPFRERDIESRREAARKIQPRNADAEIGPVPTRAGGRKPEPELNRQSNILREFNDLFGSIQWTDSDRIHRLITHDIPNRVAADPAYQNGKTNSDRQNVRIAHNRALVHVMTARR